MLVNFNSKDSSCIINTSELVGLKYYEELVDIFPTQYRRYIGATMKDGKKIVIYHEKDLDGCDGNRIVAWLFQKLTKSSLEFATIDISDYILQSHNDFFANW